MPNKRIVGTVIRGAGRGRDLGFPTANLQLQQPQQRPADGVYAAWATISPSDKGGVGGLEASPPVPGRESYMAAVHVGPVPTFNEDSPTVEVHLLDFPDHDLYDQELTIEIITKLRDVEKFSSAEKLVAAIEQDIQQTQHRLTKA